jgi:hypothetical protein
MVLACAREPWVNEEAKLQEVLTSIVMKGGNDPVITTKVITLCLQQLKEEVEYHCKLKEAEAEAKENAPSSRSIWSLRPGAWIKP